MEILLNPASWVALLTLTLLEIVLGIDNIIFISILTNKLPEHQRQKARSLGLAGALILRIMMLFGITWIIGFTQPVFSLFDKDFSGRDLILIAGGIFLLIKSISEIHNKVGGEEESHEVKKKLSFSAIILQIMLLDLVFSFDSILTAIGMIDQIAIMIAAVVISLIVMIVFAGQVSTFINQNPTIQVLALSFLILIGFVLIVDGLDVHVPKGYVYFALFFSLVVEMLNLRMRKKSIKKEG